MVPSGPSIGLERGDVEREVKDGLGGQGKVTSALGGKGAKKDEIRS